MAVTPGECISSYIYPRILSKAGADANFLFQPVKISLKSASVETSVHKIVSLHFPDVEINY